MSAETSRGSSAGSRIALGVVAVALACSRASAPPVDPAFAADWKAWHDAREARLRAPDGWLALAGLHWLADGPNVIPGLPGTFVLEGGRVTLRATPADGYGEDGQAVTEKTLATDQAPRPDRLTVGAKRVAVIDRGGKLAIRVWDAESPVRTGFKGVEAFPPDPRWRIEATWEAYPAPRKVEIPSVAGPPQAGEAPGRARFTVDGQTVALEPTLEDGELFFVFRDRTAPKETYGAGRFLVAAAPKDGKVVLDFNRAYDPPCAFTPYATCPLPRPENVLAVRIPAGEKKYGGH
ncbi:DUF1684 domain-containing protein [Anaeromyxobacter oryzae]|uniref:DUF1684 domain-containing protein n=1 Tax=Anaeromyxobacter oryzae TaxID=2918170 RepID=A0ABM7WVS9_9BACT|nr:DUF1684 domain-containing protein [Anaeromyxobacter oryzae]BDG03613.1 hypothetical protein AMOR_26090 [Anaeromyxobacter oryzae]